MKNYKFLLFLLLFFTPLQLNSIQKNSFEQSNTPFILKNNYISLALLTAGVYFHKTILKNIRNYPYSSSIASYLIMTYTCDVLLKIQERHALFILHNNINEAALLLIASIALDNYIATNVHLHKKYKDFSLDSIAIKLPYTFLDATYLTIKTHQDLQLYTEKLQFYIPMESEECVHLSYPENINFDKIQQLINKDKILKEQVLHFLNDPSENVDSLIHFLTNKLTFAMQNLDKNIQHSTLS